MTLSNFRYNQSVITYYYFLQLFQAFKDHKADMLEAELQRFMDNALGASPKSLTWVQKLEQPSPGGKYMTLDYNFKLL